ncbi:MAG TPA: response regulator [Vicinamibacterales bacterium]
MRLQHEHGRALNRILVLDANQDTREWLVGLLSTDYRVAAVTDAAAARRVLELEPPDLLLVDVTTREGQGSELVRELRRNPRWTHMPIVVLATPGGRDDGRTTGLVRGADDFLVRPFSAEELLARVAIQVTLSSLRRDREEERRNSEMRLSLARQAAGVATWEWNLMTGDMTWSRELYALLGYPPDAFPPSHQALLDAVHPEDRFHAAGAWRDAIERGTDVATEYRIVRPSGETRWVVVRGTVVLDRTARIHRAMAVFLDVTESRRRLEQLQALAAVSVKAQSAGSLESTLRVITDEARRIIGARQAITRLNAGSGVPGPVMAISSPDAHARDAAAFTPVHAGIHAIVCRENRPVRLTSDELRSHPAWQQIGADETVQGQPGSWLAVPLIGTDGRNMGAIQLFDRHGAAFTDADEAMLVQLAGIASAALEQARLFAEAQEANRVKDEFLATLSHELRTPLNAILGWASLLGSEKVRPELVRRAVDVIVRNAKQQATLIEDILDVSRIVTGRLRLHPAELDARELLESVVAAISPSAASKGIEVQAEGLTELGAMTGDEARLQQVFWNLLSNAIKFTPSGGRVSVNAIQDAVELRVVIRDTGVGIPAEFLPHVFERFRQADASSSREYGGLGIGLAIVQHIVQAHGGSVTAESDGPGTGTTFTVRLPRRGTAPLPAVDLAPGPAASRRPLVGVRLNGISVLSVDDDEDARELVAQVLVAAGAEVRTASNGAEALEVIDRWRPHVILCDLGMPEMDGWELIRRLRIQRDGASIPVVALTAYARREDRLRAQREGFRVHLAKPVDPAELVTVVAALSARPGEPRP